MGCHPAESGKDKQNQSLKKYNSLIDIMQGFFILLNAIFGLTRILHVPEAFICKAFKGTAVEDLLQALDNAANGRLRHARRVKTFEELCPKTLAQTVTSQLGVVFEIIICFNEQ